MREFREVRINVGGDRAKGHTHITLARKLLGGLKNRMALGGLSQLKGRQRLQDGTFIEVRSAFGLDAIDIFTPILGASATAETIAERLGRVTLRLTVEDPAAFVVFALTDAGSATVPLDNRYFFPLDLGWQETFVDVADGFPNTANPAYAPLSWASYHGPNELVRNALLEGAAWDGSKGPFLIDLCTFAKTLTEVNGSISHLTTFLKLSELATEQIELPFLLDTLPPYQTSLYTVFVEGTATAGSESFSVHHQAARGVADLLKSQGGPEVAFKPALKPPYRLYAKYVTNARKLDYRYQLKKRGEPYALTEPAGSGFSTSAKIDTRYDAAFDGGGEMTLSGADLRSLQIDAHRQFTDLYRKLWSSETFDVQIGEAEVLAHFECIAWENGECTDSIFVPTCIKPIFEGQSFSTDPRLWQRPSKAGSVPTKLKIEWDIMGKPDSFRPVATHDLEMSDYGFNGSSFGGDIPKKGDGWIHVLTIDPEKNSVAFVGKPHE